MLDLNDLALFVQVVRAGSFSEAARRLRMPANTLSRRIDQFEGHIGTRLLHRSTRKLAPSTEGLALFERYAPALDRIFEIERQHADGQEPAGTVRVAAMAGLFEVIKLEWLAEFYARHPRISIDFLLDDTPSDLIAERIDLALRIGIETGGSFRVRRIAPGTMILAASPAYLERRGTPRTPRELADHDCLTVSSRQGRSMWRLQGPRGTQEISIDSRFSVNDMRVVMQACLAGLGIALVPQVLAAAAIDEGKLARVLPAYQRSGAGLGLQLVYTSRPPLPPAVTAVAEFLLEKLDQGMSRCPEPAAGR
ncbi:TPA: LysR family transcriptional regulator [Burkholderia cenocepacia]|uniref:Transcriptional regulator, LysR family n=1 Tax=Burkholderia orbicola (strain MC0-3) TaxID=406425 RepID=B1KBK4_BURO0|nr:MULTISPECIES: LysR family transcriptional regulator [Burkholderia cepacia complex]ACA95601.1 transcriptional regulator, LysR family [Burkholderia orbicola MC0-3]MBR8154812.1 LysR family transcriptional regulator [Burkholderia cenocepacia]MBR8197652.1 LysR family transcriptional regulator [Burkholderia cenocepacia]MCA8082459.1 LysR family transcriptional regulator [Burkholderia cenocepacia]MDN7559324.1 LysR family transcriptional regulator [Burkholderia orbicola]